MYSFRREAAIPFESTLERDFLVVQEFCGIVLQVVAQPATIRFVDLAGRKRSYTPDFLVLYRTDPDVWGEGPVPLLVEIKHRVDLRRDWAELRPKFRAAVRYAREHGWRFRIRDELDVRNQIFRNVMFLKRYERLAFAPEETHAFLERTEQMGQSPIHYLIASLFCGRTDTAVAIAHVWHLLATKQLACDFGLPLSQHTIVWRANHGQG